MFHFQERMERLEQERQALIAEQERVVAMEKQSVIEGVVPAIVDTNAAEQEELAAQAAAEAAAEDAVRKSVGDRTHLNDIPKLKCNRLKSVVSF